MTTYAVIDDRNQQYRVAPGDRIRIHYRNDAEEGASLTFDKVCCVGGDSGAAGRVGTPHVAGATVAAKVVRQVKGPKLYIGKFRRRKNYQKRSGFRAKYTEVQIESING
ncbi:MAG: 50S ribosomal protein L21 [Planctomycetes bacterium]|nr:50S ribosomal protein L21 [Planctomycetota bacterium]